MFNWRRKDEFWPWFTALAQARGQGWRFLDGQALISATATELGALAPHPPVETPADEDDFPGPVLRWYGDAGGEPVLVTHFLDTGGGDYTELTVERPLPGALVWTSLEPLMTHAPELVVRVSWVQHAAGMGAIAVHARGPRAPEEAIYRSDSESDARGLVALLTRAGGDWRYELTAG
jgi:hypothetical protein